jgi:hypothetical protein
VASGLRPARRRQPDALEAEGGWQQHSPRILIGVVGVGLSVEPLGWGVPTQRLMRPTLVVVLHPGIQDLLGDLGAGQRRQGGQQLLGQGLVEPLDLAGGGRGPDPGQPVGDGVLPQDPLEQHLGRAGLAEPAGELLAVEFLTGVKSGWMS